LQFFCPFLTLGDDVGLIQSDGPFLFLEKDKSGDVLKAKKKY